MFLNPKNIFSHLHIVPHMEVAVFEARNHFFILPLLSILSKGGRLYSVGSNLELLQKVFNEGKHIEASHHILKAHVEKKNGVPLKDGSLDFILLDNVFFSFSNHKEAILEIKRLLKKGGRVLVIDWQGSFAGIGPHPDHVVTKKQTHDFFGSSGFSLINDIDAGNFHFALMFRKEKE